jgi:hypothetical protein
MPNVQWSTASRLSSPTKVLTRQPALESIPRMLLTKITSLGAPVAFGALLTMGCLASAPPPPPAVVQPYEPNFSYKLTDKGKPVEVTLGIIKPQFETQSEAYRTQYGDDDVVKGMLLGMQSSFKELLVAKGFTTRGPFADVKKMTHPDKEGSDFVVFPEVNFQVTMKATNMRQVAAPNGGGHGGMKTFNIASLLQQGDDKSGAPAPGTPTIAGCDAQVKVIGDVSIVIVEPLTGETYVRQTVEVARANETVAGQQGAVCTGGTGSQDENGWSQELKNTWARVHESIFQATMKAMNDYIDSTELKNMKVKSQKVRAQKVYGN